MKVGLVCPYNIFLGGGVQEGVLAIRDGLVKRGHKAYIITPQPRDYDGPKHPGIIMVGGAAKWRSYGTTTQVSASVDLDSLSVMLKREKFDILHFHEPWAPMLSRQILTRSNAINIGTFHAALPDRIMGRTIEKVITPYTKSVLKYLDVLTAVSPAASKYVSTLTPRKIFIVPNGIDTSKYKPSSVDKNVHNKKTIFYVGRLEKRKGLKYLIKAFKLIVDEDPNFELIIAGGGPDRPKLEDQIKDEKVKNVKFLGHISEATKQRLFVESDLFCSPAIYGESFGIVLLEAMASGCVTVAGNNPGYETVLKDLGQISIVNPKDSIEFARRLKLLATNMGLRSVWREWAYKYANNYTYEKVIDRYEMMYKAAYEKQHSAKKD